MSFFKVTNGIIYICPLTVMIHLRRVSTSFTVYSKPFCEVLHNSINYFLRYKETRGWGQYTVYKTSGGKRVNKQQKNSSVGNASDLLTHRWAAHHCVGVQIPMHVRGTWSAMPYTRLYSVHCYWWKRQVSHQRWIWGIHCMHARKHASEESTLALKPRADVTRSPKQSVAPQKGLVSYKNF